MRLGILDTLVTPDVTSGLLRRAPHVLATAQGEEVVLFDVERERYYTLNEVGTRVWELLATPTTLSEIVAAIRREYEVPTDVTPDLVTGDVTRLLRELRTVRMLIVGRRPRAAR